MKVVDASVGLGWVLVEPSSPAAERWLEEHVSGQEPLVGPELLHYEVANVLATRSGLTADQALEGYRHFQALEIETYSLGAEEYEAALAFASRYGTTVYDASYVVLALRLQAPLLTADRRLAAQAARVGSVEVA